MTPQQFKAWRNRLGISQSQAGKLLGKATHTIKQYESGRRSIDKTTEILCEKLEG